jgi:hypothetical protein
MIQTFNETLEEIMCCSGFLDFHAAYYPYGLLLLTPSPPSIIPAGNLSSAACICSLPSSPTGCSKTCVCSCLLQELPVPRAGSSAVAAPAVGGSKAPKIDATAAAVDDNGSDEDDEG